MKVGLKKTLVFGASLKKERISHMAVKRMVSQGRNVVAIGGRAGHIEDVEILTGHHSFDEVDTITIYMGENGQEEHETYLLSLNPKRIIFNPGAENSNFALKARQQGIETINACTLVMLSTGEY